MLASKLLYSAGRRSREFPWTRTNPNLVAAKWKRTQADRDRSWWRRIDTGTIVMNSEMPAERSWHLRERMTRIMSIVLRRSLMLDLDKRRSSSRENAPVNRSDLLPSNPFAEGRRINPQPAQADCQYRGVMYRGSHVDDKFRGTRSKPLD